MWLFFIVTTFRFRSSNYIISFRAMEWIKLQATLATKGVGSNLTVAAMTSDEARASGIQGQSLVRGHRGIEAEILLAFERSTKRLCTGK